ncbi:MAG: UDP-N-acetylglucosamine 2-epimerase (non-hydrolyzing) [Verrucomicrobiota bacterium]
MRIVNVVGARPNFMKIAPLLLEYRRHPDAFTPVLVHTGQHYDVNMSDLFFQQLGIPAPDVFLGVGSGSHAEQTAKVMIEMEKLLIAQPADLVVVVGDVNSTMAATLAAAKLCIPVAHVEAGLRSGDRTMPEEVNRLVTDALSDYCFTTSQDADENLRREGVPAAKIHFVGNLMIDTLLRLKDVAGRSEGRYGLVTLHRPSNVDDKVVLTEILSALDVIQKDLPLVFPVHPRTAGKLKQFGFWDELSRWGNLKLMEPVGYLDSLRLMGGATMVLTDSGGVQEETTALGVPCLTIRENTERPVTVTEGTNTLVGTSHAKIVAEARQILAGHGKRGRIPKYWDGQAARRIVECLLRK